jgi:protein O-GlcNAc transferase
MKILLCVPGSVLWLFKGSQKTVGNLRKEALTHGVAENRLVFAERADQSLHLARHKCADLFLDTTPYNAHTTTSDALWAGLPVLTMPGKSFASRVAGSLLHAVGMQEFVVNTRDDYVAKAIAFGLDEGKMAAAKMKLQENIGSFPLFKTEQFTRDFESILEGLNR